MQDLAPEIAFLDTLHYKNQNIFHTRSLKKIGIQECPVRNTLL